MGSALLLDMAPILIPETLIPVVVMIAVPAVIIALIVLVSKAIGKAALRQQTEQQKEYDGAARRYEAELARKQAAEHTTPNITRHPADEEEP